MKRLLLRQHEAVTFHREGRVELVRAVPRLGFVGPRDCEDDPRCWGYADEYGDYHTLVNDDPRLTIYSRSLGAPDEVRWVAETWSHTGDGVWCPADARNAMNGRLIYAATDPAPCAGCWFSSAVMPPWASRTTATLTEHRVTLDDGAWSWRAVATKIETPARGAPQ